MDIFITGATGYVGNALTRRLLSEGASIKAFCRPPSRKLLPDHQCLQPVEGELLDVNFLKSVMKSCRYVYHLAAYARVWSHEKDTYHRINVKGTEAVLEAAGCAGVSKVVVTSTAGVFGPQTISGMPVSEDSTRAHPFFNEYEETKWMAEEVCRDYATKGLNVVVVNPSRIYGPGLSTESNAVCKLIQLFLQGKWRFIPGDGDKVGNYVFIDDVVNGHTAAMQFGKSGSRYILGGENCTYKDFFFLLRELTEIRQRLYKLPLGVMLAFSRLEVLKASVFKTHPLITPEWVKKYLYHWPLSSEKASQELGYTITPLKEGLRETIEYIKRTMT